MHFLDFAAPLRFAPLYHTRVWGGRRLETVLGRRLPEPAIPYGESWEISDREGDQSVVVSGPCAGLTLHELWTHHRRQVFGEAQAGNASLRFPLLMKILDACDDLSIQVHPPASVAAELGGEPKTEMWYIAHADQGAKIYAGLLPGVTRADFEKALAAGAVADCVGVLEPSTGDCLFLPSGRIHAIGAGLLIYEIQQNSDTTYRVFDWNRVGLDGKPRPLHVQESLRSIDFTDTYPQMQTVSADGVLVRCGYFEVKIRHASHSFALGTEGEHLTFAVVRGAFTCGGETWRAGDFGLVPASLTAAHRAVTSPSFDAAWLEVRLP